MEERNNRKTIFFAVCAALVLLVAVAACSFSAPAAKKGEKVGKSLVIWEVGLDTQAFERVLAGFKASSPSLASLSVTAKKFATYDEYARVLPLAVADGNSPDVLVVSNDGGWNALARYVQPLPSSVVSAADFRRDFPAFFADGLLSEKARKNKDGKDELYSEIAGVPAGFETLAVFYNSRKLTGVPASWDGFPSMLQAPDSPDQAFVPLGLGLGADVPGSADAFALLLAQRGVRDYRKAGDGVRALQAWRGFASSPENGLSRLSPEMGPSGLTVLDMFVRGRVGAVVGYQSLAKDLELAAKRAASPEAKITLRSVRAAPVPQALDSESLPSGSGSAREKFSVNLVRYRAFALSKYAKNPAAATAFLKYLASKPGQSAFASAFPQFVPAHREVAAGAANSPIMPDWKVTQEAFLPASEPVSFDKGSPAAWDSLAPALLDAQEGSPERALSDFSSRVSCVASQDSGASYDADCSAKK